MVIVIKNKSMVFRTMSSAKISYFPPVLKSIPIVSGRK